MTSRPRRTLAIQALCLPLLCLAPGAARADIPDSTALLVDGDQARFIITVNGLPVGTSAGRKLAGAAFYLDTLLRPGDNEVTVTTELDAATGTVQLTLTAPAQAGQSSGARLGHAQCGFALSDGTTPACRAHDVFHFSFHLAHAPDFRLWHAEKAALSADAIATSLAAEQSALAAAARTQDWAALFLGHGPRRADLLAAGSGVRAAAAEMAHHMQDAARAHPGTIQQAKPPFASALVLTPLTANLVAVSRRDGMPLLRVKIGQGDGQDPEDFGDVSDRYLDGIYQQMMAIYGFEAGAWQRLR
jgi:hypothetical protein